MKKERKHVPSTPLLASLGAAVLVIILFLSFLFSSGLLRQRRTGAQIPSGVDTDPLPAENGQMLTAQSVAEVEITAQNAQKVVASLLRPEQYSCRISNTLCYDGGSSTMYCRRYAYGSAVRTDTVTADDKVLSTLLRAGEDVYAWNEGDTEAYRGVWGNFTDDAAAMLPTYEDVLDDGVSVLSASRQDVENDPCIRIAFEQGGYRCIYDISAASGLLKNASFYYGETLQRQVAVTELKTDRPDQDVFTLPGGVSVLGE